ncbi:histone-like protein DNA-binding protein [Deinococcus phoenicis]|uniref:Histone-like protein DNA-binding protein n=1 Tax=Deinococcus phoenicis TaxID=1476583 RepID=A0A016QTW8_9DEIO|nr:HU family DNA-binding protein [Deinococcus phoenicis]EYB69508.1 histone-like protein DNA-binding protein [Deinococcus phoenicis]
MARTTQSAAPRGTARRNAGDAAAGAGQREGGRADSGKIAKTQIIEQVAERTGLSRKQAGEAVATLLNAVTQALREGKSVGLPGLGTLSVTPTAARTGVRPGTSERIQIPAGKKIRFKLATPLKGSL